METPQDEVTGGDAIIDLTTPNAEIRTTDPEEGDGKDKGQERRAEAPVRQEPAIVIQEEDVEEDPDLPRHRGETREEYSRRVRGRINREIALRKRVERKLDQQTAVNDELRDRMVRIERAQSAGQITDDAKKKIAELNTKIEAVKARLAAAKEGGETKLEMDLTIELTDLLADKKIIERRSEYQAEQVRKDAEAGRQEPEAEGTAEERRIKRATAEWQRANRKWWNLNKFRDVRQDAIELDAALREEVKNGEVDLEEYSDEYFAELSTRLKKNYPDLDVRGLDGEAIEEEDPEEVDQRATQRDTRREQPRRDARRPAVGSMGTSDRRRDNGTEKNLAQQGRVRLSQPDYAQMRQYGLDPNNPTHKKAFARERMRTILTEGSGPTRGGAR